MNENLVKLLAIDDNPDDIRLIQQMLRQVVPDFDVRHAECLEDGLAALRGGTFDAILLDLSLPDSQRLDTLDAVHATTRTMPIVVLTGMYDEAIRLEAVRRGAQDYLMKGQFDGRLLSRSICYAIERNRAERTILDSIAERTLLEKEILQISTREQHRISRDLHDGVGQELTGLSYLAKSLAKDLSGQVISGGRRRGKARQRYSTYTAIRTRYNPRTGTG